MHPTGLKASLRLGKLTLKVREVFMRRVVYYCTIINTLVVLMDHQRQGGVNFGFNESADWIDVVFTGRIHGESNVVVICITLLGKILQ